MKSTSITIKFFEIVTVAKEKEIMGKIGYATKLATQRNGFQSKECFEVIVAITLFTL